MSNEVSEHYEIELPTETLVDLSSGPADSVPDGAIPDADGPDYDSKVKKLTFRRERGTTVDPDRIFRSYNDGEVFEVGEGPSSAQLRKMIKSDGQARQLASALKLPVKGANYDIVPHEDDSGEADFIRFALEAPSFMGGMTTPFKLILGQIANGIIERRAHFEKVWKRIPYGQYKNKVAFHKLAFRPASSCTMLTDKNGSFAGFKQRVPRERDIQEVKYRPNKAYVYIHGADEDPILGTTAFETAYRDYENKKKIKFFFFAFLENVAFPRTKVIYKEDDETGTALDDLLAKAKKFGRMGIIGLGPQEEIEPYESVRTTRDYQLALEYLDNQMAKSCMAQFLDLGTQGERGSYALSKDKSTFFYNSLESTLDEIAESINQYIIADLIYFNFGPEAAYPKLVFKPIEDETLQDSLDIFKAVIAANQPNIVPGFMAQLMEKVTLGLELNIDKVKKPDPEDIAEIIKTIPAATPRAIDEPQPEMAAGIAAGVAGKDQAKADLKAQADKEKAETKNRRPAPSRGSGTPRSGGYPRAKKA